jgi:prepilin-type N-terminal cleavage/methylation domain-containing protein
MRARATSSRGFSLIEMVAAIVVLGILVAAAAPMLVNGLRAYDATSASLVTLGKLRYATERLARELREVDHTGANYSLNMSLINPQFTKADGVTVTVNQALPNVTLAYSAPPVAPAPLLVDQVSALGFAYFDQDNNATASNVNVRYVQITLSLTQGAGTYTQRTRVALRNKP